ncbi:TPA: DUF1837 domain-containing protein [Pseudomonas aeruginosa]|uniref:HamA C-terminal domain-containing protein n=1 Tax=Pseudomonas aeruginosa group TaxID=136841 RepID=UPI000D14D94D|nr:MULTISPECIES: DUF1837 domain-containing protein [Pseudomonas aeruginosa group]AVR69856.1 DUF1837 domain-containing protein [Pseudomonas paraeruginosa]MDV7848884.1 DUF1837 domain-containing protein [Pseudomonas aeruginosa]
MDFEVLVNSSLLEAFPGNEFLSGKNKRVLSLINDYEDKRWRFRKFQEFIWNNISETSLSYREREILSGQPQSTLIAAAKNLRLTDKEGDISKGSELAEIVLYGIMKHQYDALPVVPKIFYKQNSQDNAKGADSVHLVLEGDDDFSLWFGEAKFYNNIEDARLAKIIESVGNSLNTDKLRKENSIITNVSDIDFLDLDEKLRGRIRKALSNKESIDSLKSKINIPILLLHECEVTAVAHSADDEYKEKIISYHLGRAKSYFEKQIESLSSAIAYYEKIKFHVILFPVPSKSIIVDKFVEGVAYYKGQ